MSAIAKIKGVYERGRWNLSNLLRAPLQTANRYHPQHDAPVTSMPSSIELRSIST